MRKISAFIIACIVCVPAMADDWYGMESPDSSCNCTATARRDNYIGLRLHQNEHMAFKYAVNGGGTTTPRRDNTGFGMYVGNRLTDHVKIEFETEYNGAKFDRNGARHDYDLWSNMLNMHLYETFGGAVEPYAGIGVGLTGMWGTVKVPDNHISDSKLSLSFAAMVGVNFALNDRIDLNMGAKYHNYGKLSYETGGNEYATTRIDATEIYIGAAYKFGMK